MSETKFTPGPWLFGGGCRATGFTVKIASDELIVGGRGLKSEANAHLIAAAPELYAKLNWIAEWMRSVEGMSRNNMEQLASEEAEEIDALLVKARGELP